jgi:NAD(P)-dependent dehydrogenase (short-subunit alcohol dehydrogenase family)
VPRTARSVATSLARDLGPIVRVNAIAPSQEAADRQTAALSFYIDKNPIPRYGVASEATGAALFLASRASSYVTGQVIFVDGGHVNAG